MLVQSCQPITGLILVANDQTANRELLEELLTAEGYQAITVADGAARATLETRHQKPRLIFPAALFDVSTPLRFRSPACLFFLSFFVLLGGLFQPPSLWAQTVTQNNIDDDTPGAWPAHSTGWKVVCIIGACGGGTPGGTVAPTSTSQTINNTTPSLDGESMFLSLASPSGMASTDNAEALWTYIAGVDENATNFQTTVHIYPGANIARANAVEMDHFSFSTSRSEEIMMAHECVLGHFWQVWNGQTANWVNTTLACSGATSLPALTWTEVVFNDHIVSGDLTDCSGFTCMHFDSITINGTVYPINMLEPAQVLPAGWASGVGMQFQMDIPYNGGSAEAVTANVDDVSFVATEFAAPTGLQVTVQ